MKSLIGKGGTFTKINEVVFTINVNESLTVCSRRARSCEKPFEDFTGKA